MILQEEQKCSKMYRKSWKKRLKIALSMNDHGLVRPSMALYGLFMALFYHFNGLIYALNGKY